MSQCEIGREARTTREPVRPETMTTFPPLSPGMRVGNLLFLSGQGPVRNGVWELGDFEQQCRLTLDNLEEVCQAAGTSLRHAVKVTAWLRDYANFAEWNRIYPEYFSQPLPARTTVPCALDGFEIEVDAIVEIPA